MARNPNKVRCTAMAKHTLKQCKRWSVPGKDKCRLHGGATPVKHGLYSKYLPTNLAAKYQEFLADPDLKTLRKELAMTKAILADVLDALSKNKPDLAAYGNVLAVVEQIRKLIGTTARMEREMGMVVEISQIQVIIKAVVHVVQVHVNDPKTREKIGRDLAKISVR